MIAFLPRSVGVVLIQSLFILTLYIYGIVASTFIVQSALSL